MNAAMRDYAYESGWAEGEEYRQTYNLKTVSDGLPAWVTEAKVEEEYTDGYCDSLCGKHRPPAATTTMRPYDVR